MTTSAREPQRSKPIRVLVVEDDPDNARLVEYILRREGYEVVVAGTAETAIEVSTGATTTDPFALVVTDLVLPGIDGLELARALRAIEPDLPMIAMTAYSTPDHADRARSLEISEYLHKPLMAPALVRSVRRALQQAERGVLA